MKVCKVVYDGSWIIFGSLDDALDSLKYDLSEIETDVTAVVEITMQEMTEEEYNSLPEFEGF